ncbi:MAG: putative superfamily ATPase [Rickettsiaceae bacterium]|jgi:predicted AAA+ superfamily ATPase|nr:putative superfamily ATPase [Rickettsiaceae bacterium]
MLRQYYIKQIRQYFKINPICAILGPRQCGKTTLSKQFAKELNDAEINIFDLENPIDLARLDNPLLALQDLKGLIIIDEIQRRPELFPILRVLADSIDAKFLILGSASRELIKQSSETLAGRISYIELTPFSLSEVNEIKNLWIRGGFPRSYLAESDEDSYLWRESYIRTYLEQDIPNLGFQIAPRNIHRFWMMLSNYHGQIFNASEIGRSLGITDHTAKNYLDILEGTFMIRSLQPWFENISKRQVKSPKIYFRDSGILHNLLGLRNKQALDAHPKLGASWEGFALEEVLKTWHIPKGECYYWATHGGAELDLLVFKDGKKIGLEFKYTDFPKITPSMKYALEDLKLDKLIIIYPGDKNFKLGDNIEVISLENFR